MKRTGGILVCVLAFVMCAGCRAVTVDGVWTCADPSAYYFELHQDGTCVMFDSEHEWVSSGTFTEHKNGIAFETDTGSFTWVWDEEHEAMRFDSGNEQMYYSKE